MGNGHEKNYFKQKSKTFVLKSVYFTTEKHYAGYLFKIYPLLNKYCTEKGGFGIKYLISIIISIFFFNLNNVGRPHVADAAMQTFHPPPPSPPPYYNF
jgi:hypothetical protein